MNAFDLYKAAFDSAQAEFYAETASYVQGYADGALNRWVSESVAHQIASCKAQFDAEGENSDDFYRMVEEPLSAIEL